MRQATKKQASMNERGLRIEKTGYGHWRISCMYRNKRISTVTTDSVSVDHWNSDEDEITQGQNAMRLGYNSLIWQIVRANKDRY